MTTQETQEAQKPPPRHIVLRNLVIVAVLSLVIAGILIDHKIGGTALAQVRPIVKATGMSQSWGVFAPPRRVSRFLDTRTEYADGTHSTWRLPGQGAAWDYTGYRWRKYGEYVQGKERKLLWDPLARYVLEHKSARGRQVDSVILATTRARQMGPGKIPHQKPWRTKTFHVLRPARTLPGEPS